MEKVNKYFLPRPQDLPQLRTPDGHPIPFAQLLAIDVDNISGEFEIQAAWLATLGYAHAVAESESSKWEKAVKRKEASLYFHYQMELKKADAKATVDAIKNSVILDGELQELEDEAAEKAEIAAVLKSAVRAYGDRKDMLVNLSADERLNKVRMVQRVEN